MSRHPQLFAVSLLLAVGSFSPATRAQGTTATDPRFARIDALAAAEYTRNPIGSLTVGVVDKSGLVWSKSYGFADSEAKRPATPETVYRIGSITKQFTALMFLQLAEQGKLRMSDPLQQYLPESAKIPALYPGMPPVTLMQVATMTAGFSREPSGLAEFVKGPVSEWDQKLLAAIPNVTYLHEPGTKFFYSNIGYGMLGLALSRAAGQPFTEYVREHILKPLGMDHTDFEVTDRLRPSVARGYNVRDGKDTSADADAEVAGRGYKVPNGALYSTVGDLARFVSFELGHGPSGVLKKATHDDYYTRIFTVNADFSSGYGVGLQAFREDVLALGHGGSTAGFVSWALYHQTSGTGVVLLQNRSNDGLLDVATKMLAAAAVGNK